MRVLFTSLVNPTHLRPMLPLAWSLRSMGHEVVVASAPNMTTPAQAVGLNTHGFGEKVDPARSQRKHWRDGRPPLGRSTPERYRAAGERIGALGGRGVDQLITFSEGWRPDLMVHCPMEMAGRVAGAALGVPSLVHRWGVDTLTPFVDGAHSALEPTCDRLGIDIDRLVPCDVIDPCPASLQLPDVRQGIPIRYQPINGAHEIEPWMWTRSDRPRVCVTFGNATVSMGGAPMMRAAIAALRAHDVEVIVAIAGADADLLGIEQSEHIRVIQSVPLELFMSTCDVLVHHGGTGSSFAAVESACPQLVLPQRVDAYEYGDGIEAMGAGFTVESPEDQCDVDLIADRITELLDNNDLRCAADRLADEARRRPSAPEVALSITARFG